MKIGRKKRVSYWLFCYIVLTEWTFLDQLWAWQQGVFHWIFSKMKCKSCVFERVDVFLTKYVHESRVLREWMIFWQNMGMGVEFFFVKNMRKKCFFVIFWPIIYIILLTELTFFFTKYMHESGGVFLEKCGKHYMRAQFLWECTFLWRNRGMRVLCFLGKGRFFWDITIGDQKWEA